MIFEPLSLNDAWLIKLNSFSDDRGHYARAWCRKEFEEHGINPNFVQMNTVFSKRAGTLRGMHWQTEPAAEPKYVRCIRGSIFDVIVDMRPESSTYLQYVGTELSAENQTMIYVPGNFAHGFLTLEDNAEACYMVGEYYTPEVERGMRYDDPTVGIQWPMPVQVISEKDKSWPLRDSQER